MPRRKVRRRKPGRRVYYPRFSHYQVSQAMPRKEILSILHSHTAQHTDAARRARENHEHQQNERIFRVFGIDRSALDVTEFDSEGDRRAKVEDARQRLLNHEDVERHVVIHKGLRTVRVLFWTSDHHRWWFVEHDLFQKELDQSFKRSVVYGSREQAMTRHELDYITWL